LEKLGVSFGGIIATEISKLTKPKYTILINKGEHFMIFDKAEEISEIINEKIK
jgi:surfactin synthase thioesterase subunit